MARPSIARFAERAHIASRHGLMVEECASALVEFAASAIVLFTLVFGILECSRAVYAYHFVANAAQEAARYAAVRGASWSTSCGSTSAASCMVSSSNVSAFAQSLVSAGISPSKLSVTTSWPGANAAGGPCQSPSSLPVNTVGCVVLVKVSYAFAFVSPLLPQQTLTLSSSSEVTIVQ